MFNGFGRLRRGTKNDTEVQDFVPESVRAFRPPPLRYHAILPCVPSAGVVSDFATGSAQVKKRNRWEGWE